jgi:hypothetical protein
MPRNCRHTMPTGRTCQSPAMRESAYCYFHSRLHRYPHYRSPTKKQLKLLALDSPKAIQTSLADVMNSILSGRIDPRRAGKVLYGIQIAAATLGRAANAFSEQLYPEDEKLSRRNLQGAATLRGNEKDSVTQKIP